MIHPGNPIDDDVRVNRNQLTRSRLTPNPAAMREQHEAITREKHLFAMREAAIGLSTAMWRAIRATSAKARARQTTGTG